MRVLFSLLDAGIGGGQRVAIRIAGELVRRGHGVGVLVPAPGPAADELETLGADVHVVDVTSLRRPLGAVRAARTLSRYDLLYSHTSASGEILGALAALLARRPHVAHRHIYPPFSARPLVGALQRRLFRLLPGRGRFIAVAEHVADSLAALGVPRDRIEVVPNGTVIPRHEELPPAGGDPLVVGLLGRLDPQKGADVFVEAARRAGLGPRARFVIAGPAGPFVDYERAVRRAAAEAGVETVEPSEPGESFLGRLDIVAMPSRYEGQPLILLEAMARAKPIVASAIPGIREVLEPEDAGILVPPGDPDALAAAIARLAGDPALRRDLGRRAREVAGSRYALDEILDRTLQILSGEARRGTPPRTRRRSRPA